MKLKNKVVVITGAGSGIGKAMTDLFAQEGAKIIAADINGAGVEESIGNCKCAEGEITFCKTDVSNREQVEAMIDMAINKYGRLDVMVNNAGILDKMRPLDEVEDDLWNKVLAINLNGVMYGSRKALEIMRPQGSGVILNTASVSGIEAGRGGVAYTASKHAVVGLTKNTAFVYAKEGIRCNAICPGNIATNISAGLGSASKFGMERYVSGTANMPATGQADEIAKTALFLVSDDASFVNGATVVVDGGWTAY